MRHVRILFISLSFCFSFSVLAIPLEDLIAQGKALLNDGYTNTGLVDVEEARLPIHSTFESSYDVLGTFVDKAHGMKPYNEFYNAMQGKSEDEIKAAFSALPPATQKEILAYEDSNKEIMMAMGKLAAEFYLQNELFDAIDVKALAKSEYSMWELAKKGPKIYSAVDHTKEEIVFVKDSVIEIHRISSVLSTFKAAA